MISDVYPFLTKYGFPQLSVADFKTLFHVTAYGQIK